MINKYHEPVLINEVIEFLNCKSEGTYVDATLGGGGWAEAILEASKANGKLIGFDRDEEAIEESKKRLEKFSDRFSAVKAKFSEIVSELEKREISSVDGIVADLGVSSHQFDVAERGFSFSGDSTLDMRMDSEQELRAFELVNSCRAEELADWFFEFGEERLSRRVARAIVREREKSPIETTGQLANIVARALRRSPARSRTHPATKVFQALRIVVNDEVGELQSLLKTMPGFLSSGGRMIIASYHSLEDRPVKRGFLELAKSGDYRRITKKPVWPTEEEVNHNRRARSARLRVLERV
jgi:16S rRNA (cytosine1402-N4)-methyltransferase